MKTQDALIYSLRFADLRLIENGKWHSFGPNEFPGLNETFGDEYEELYLKYEHETDWSNLMHVIYVWL